MKRAFALLLFLCLAFGSFAPAFAQETAPKPAAAAAPAATESTQDQAKTSSKSVWQHIRDGGPIMIVIGICSVATLYLIVDGLARYTNFKKTVPEEHVEGLKHLFRAGDYQGAYKFCKANPSPVTNVCRAALTMAGEGKNAAEEAMYAETAKENARMQYFISYLSVIGVCTPMIGLLGTVFGMISAFATLGTSGIGDPSKLSAAIGEVLIATASGLLIAIPAFFSFYWLRNRSAKIVHKIQETMAMLFRKMPYEHLAGAHLGDEELYAATPNWVQPQPSLTEAA
jgi:biopolymer transport protein ExbB